MPDFLSQNPLPIEEVPPELTDSDWKQWASAMVLASAIPEDSSVGLANSAFAEERSASADLNLLPENKNGALFHMPDIQSIVACVKEWQCKDDKCRAALAYLQKGEAPVLIEHQQWIAMLGKQMELDEYGILFLHCNVTKRRLIYVPECAREAVVREAHLLLGGAHISRQKTTERLRESFFSPGLLTDATHYCNTCNVCCEKHPGALRALRPGDSRYSDIAEHHPRKQETVCSA